MTNPIDPKRLKAVLKAIDPYKMAPPSTELYVYGVPIVRKVLEADDQ